MSRIIVKNIPKVFSEHQISLHFKLLDQVTDCQIARDQEGKSRGFAFVGFKGTTSAAQALKKYSNTYLGTSKIRIDTAKLRGGEEQSRERSRDGSKKKRQGSKEESQGDVFDRYKKMIQDKAKKSWDDLVVPEQKDLDEDSNESGQKKKVVKVVQKEKKIEQKPQRPMRPEDKPIRAPRISTKNKKFVTKALQIDSNRLYVTNIPYNLTDEEVKANFRKFGNITKVKLPREYDGRNKGYCFLTFEQSEQALRAFSQCDNKIMFGRIIHVKPSLEDIGQMISTAKESQYQAQIQQKYGDILEEGSSYKKKKKRQMREKYNDTTNWNTLFLNPNTVLQRIAKKLHITKSEILVSENLAPKVALAEAEVIQQTKNWMTQNGLNLDFMEKDRNLCQRSTRTLIVKNLNFKTQESQLKELLEFYGVVNKFLMAPNRSMAIVEFQSSQFADNALKSLQNHKFKNNYLFVEFAPIGMMSQQAVEQQIKVAKQEQEEAEELSKVVYVKNLNFQSDDAQLYELFEKVGPVKYAKVVRGKDGRSMGFGFVEYESHEKAVEAVKKHNNYLLDGHKLLLSLSRKAVKNSQKIQQLRQKVKTEELKSSKLMIRNIAFQATKRDIKELFQEYGTLTKVRLPKKMDGTHRGFAFVEYNTAEEAALAREVLGVTHLYGRKLVIEYEKGSS